MGTELLTWRKQSITHIIFTELAKENVLHTKHGTYAE